jgi:hypothetical protein
MKLEEQDIKYVYTAGMNLANKLRLTGQHEEANQIEIWILSLCEELKGKV